MPIKSYEELSQKKKLLSDILLKAADCVEKAYSQGVPTDGKALADLKEKLDKDTFKVLVIGEFKNGKSTFINALLGNKILPAYSTPCTAVINEVKWGGTPQAMLYFKKPLPDEMSTDIRPEAIRHIEKYRHTGDIPPIHIDVKELVDYVAIPDPTKDQADSIKELPYDKVVLQYPLGLCKDGIEIIDSPGLNEHGSRTKVTDEYLAKADAIVFVFRCPKITSITEMSFIENKIVPGGHDDIFFVCNAINQVPEDERERLMRFGRKKLSGVTKLGDNGVFFVDALGALKAKQNNNTSLLPPTGMIEFESALSEYLRNNRGKTKLMQIVGPCETFLNELNNMHITGYIASLKQSTQELEKKVKEAQPTLDLAIERKKTISLKINLFLEKLEKEISELMNIQYTHLIKELPDVIENMDIDNYLSINPFKQKESKSALENEVVTKVSQYIESEMGKWMKTDLNDYVENSMKEMEKDIGRDLDSFYDNIDNFRCSVTGVQQIKDVSGFSRVMGTIVGTIAGGPAYGAIGASMGFLETAKRSAITSLVGASLGALLAFTPLGLGAISIFAVVGWTSAGIMQLVKGKESLTKKYKKSLTKNLVDSVQSAKDKGAAEYAKNICEKIGEKLVLINQALDNEVQMEKGKIENLILDKKRGETVNKKTISELQTTVNRISDIIQDLVAFRKSIE